MHIFFSGIGGTAIGPLALIAKQAGFEISGSDKQNSQYIEYLRKKGITNIHIDQTREAIATVHDANPIDWYVYSSAVEKENPHAPELQFVAEQNIKSSKRSELINLILREKKLKMVAIAGTHGKTTTTAMTVWAFKELGLPVSYSVGAKISFGDMGQYQTGSEYFIYEADEFDHNFLAFEPHLSLITGVTWDHHEIFPAREDYQAAFKEFIGQSEHTFLWEDDAVYLNLQPSSTLTVMEPATHKLNKLTINMLSIKGYFNRLDAWLVINAVHKLTGADPSKLIEIMNRFPGLQRRMEQITPGLYSDYAHTPEKIRGAMSVALEMAEENKQNVVVVYEPLTNRRQHYMFDDYKDCFAGAAKVYWIPSYLAREDPAQRIISPSELITHLSDPSIAEPMERDAKLKKTIQTHLDDGDMVVCMAGGGGDSLDEWLRQEFAS